MGTFSGSYIIFQGKRWVGSSRRCEQNALIEAVLKNGANCDSLREDGFDSRPLCYDKTNFCRRIARRPDNVEALGNIYNLPDSDTMRALTQVSNWVLFDIGVSLSQNSGF